MEKMVRATRTEAGCLRYDLYRAGTDPPTFHLFETYVDGAALEAHRATQHYVEYRQTVPELLSEPIGVVVLEPVDAEA
jgi:quinol monooxygenase YgiN